jgi:hypothetical protein
LLHEENLKLNSRKVQEGRGGAFITLQMIARLCDAAQRPTASNILGYVGASAVIAVFRQGIELLNSIQDRNDIQEAPWA